MMPKPRTGTLPKSVQWSFELMAMIYVAAAALFIVSPDWPILMINKAFAPFEWPAVFFPTERFWLSIAVGVPGTRAFVAFSAARRPDRAKFCVHVLQISLLIPAALFAWQFLSSKHAPLYVLGFLAEVLQVIFYRIIAKKLP